MDQSIIDVHRQAAKLETQNAYLQDKIAGLETTIQFLVSQLSRSHELAPGDGHMVTSHRNEGPAPREQQAHRQLVHERASTQQQTTSESHASSSPQSAVSQSVNSAESFDLLGLEDTTPATSQQASTPCEVVAPACEPDQTILDYPYQYRAAGHDSDSDHRSSGPDATRAYRAHTRRRHVPYFLFQRLLNSACFIEEYTDDEKDQFWDGFSELNKVLCKSQWQAYYERRVRPVHLEKTVTPERGSMSVDSAAIGSAGFQQDVKTSSQPPDTATLEAEHSDLHSRGNVSVERPYLGPSLRGTPAQLDAARAFLDEVTSRPRRRMPPQSTADDAVIESEYPAPPADGCISTSAVDTDRTTDMTSVLVQGISPALQAEEAITALQPSGMILARFASTAGMKTVPKTETNSLLLVFSTAELADVFCSKHAAVCEGWDATRHGTTAARIPSECKLVSARVALLIKQGVTCGLLVETEGRHTAQQLVHICKSFSQVPTNHVRMDDQDDMHALLVFVSVEGSWSAQNILRDRAGLVSHFVDPWADQEAKLSPDTSSSLL